METHIFKNPPPADFGKAAIQKEKRSKSIKMNIIKIAIIVGGFAGILVLIGNTTNGLSFLSDANTKNAKAEKNKSKPQETPTGGITVTKKWEMPKVLTEISGLSYINEQRFACVQDELGTIFIYNTANSSIEKEIIFGAAGDYEGLAVVGEVIWVLRADGKLFEVNGLNATKPSITEHGTHLTIKQDSEGLCYDKNNNRLLIAIKGAEPGSEDYKGIYSFDLNSKKMDQQPVYKIDLQDEIFESNGSGKKKKSTINPSGISIHPLTGDMYITDGRNSKLLIMGSDGKIRKLYQLSTKEFAQPEGVSFNDAGDLFISNEGTTGLGNILQIKIN